MLAELPFVVSLPEATISALNALGDANKRAGRGPTSRSAIIKHAIEKLLAESRSPGRTATATRERK